MKSLKGNLHYYLNMTESSNNLQAVIEFQFYYNIRLMPDILI